MADFWSWTTFFSLWGKPYLDILSSHLNENIKLMRFPSSTSVSGSIWDFGLCPSVKLHKGVSTRLPFLCSLAPCSWHLVDLLRVTFFLHHWGFFSFFSPAFCFSRTAMLDIFFPSCWLVESHRISSLNMIDYWLLLILATLHNLMGKTLLRRKLHTWFREHEEINYTCPCASATATTVAAGAVPPSPSPLLDSIYYLKEILSFNPFL